MAVSFSSLNRLASLKKLFQSSAHGLSPNPDTAGSCDVATSDLATSADPTVHAGDKVLVTGCNIGESLDGGLAEFARVPGSAVVPLPTGLSLFEAMTLGTAGFTAAMTLHRMLENHQTPTQGPIAVTGATGGVGSIAILLLKQAGFRVCAITGKTNYASQLIELGADEILDRRTLDLGSKPLERAVWGGAVDNLGGDILTYLTRTVRPWGNIACIGLAQSAELTSTVMPLILRGVSLLGIHSIEVPRALRLMLWEQLGGPWKPAGLTSAIVRGVIELKDVPRVCAELVAGQGPAVLKAVAATINELRDTRVQAGDNQTGPLQPGAESWAEAYVASGRLGRRNHQTEGYGGQADLRPRRRRLRA